MGEDEDAIEGSKFFNPIAGIAPVLFPKIGEGGYNRSIDRMKKKSEKEPEPDPTEVLI